MPLRLGHRRRPHGPRQRQRRLTRALLRQAGRPAVRRAAARAQRRRKACDERPERREEYKFGRQGIDRRALPCEGRRKRRRGGEQRPARFAERCRRRGGQRKTSPGTVAATTARPGLDGSYTISISATGANGQPGRRLDTGARRYQRRRCRPDPASAHRGRAKGADQPDPIDQPLTIPVPFPGAGKTPVIRGSA
jgi:hypothetical protein